jgi:ABC-type uncharacterized transport system substrate-binding protein
VIPRLSRREFVIGGAASGVLLAGCGRLPWPGPVPVPQTSQAVHIGCLLAATRAAQADRLTVFQEGLAHYGYVEGRNIALDLRFADGVGRRLPALAAELVALQVAVIVIGATAIAKIVGEATSTIPIIVAGTSGDLIADGLAASLARPGGNVTGLSTPYVLRGKNLLLISALGCKRDQAA